MYIIEKGAVASSFSCRDSRCKGSKFAMHCMLCVLTLSTLVFVAFTQPCIQSNGTHIEGVENVLCIKGPLTLKEGRLIVAVSPVGLVVHQSEEAALLTFWDL